MPAAPNQAAGDHDALAMALGDYCRAQIKLVSDALRRRSHVHRGVHEARKGIRRLRSVISLGLPYFGDSAMRIDRALQRLGRSLSRVRDAQVALDVARRKAGNAASPAHRSVWQRTTTALIAARRRAMRQARVSDPAFKKRLAMAERIGAAVQRLPWAEVDPAMLHARLKRSRKRAGRAADRYLDEPLLLHLHKLRRRLRRYRMQLAALTAIQEVPAPAPVARKIDAIIGRYFDAFERVAHRVDQLGEVLDTRLLRSAIRRLPAGADRTKALELLREPDQNHHGAGRHKS